MSAFSTWDKELHKIVFDPRYLLLNPKERKQVYLVFLFAALISFISHKYQHILCCAPYVLPSLFCVIMSFQVFDQYVKTRAEEERKEKKNKLMQAKDEFRRMMEDAKLTPRYVHIIKNSKVFKNISCFFLFAVLSRTTFSEFAVKFGRDSRFKTIEKMKDREAIFVEFMTAMRKREKEDSKTRGEKVLLSIDTKLSPLLFFICS